VQREINTFQIGETTIEYSIIGKGQQHILLFHGGHSNCCEEFGYETLLSSGYSIITPSRAGYGKTSSILDLKQACSLYKALLDHLQVEKVHVIAVSAGGPTGICFVSMYPECVYSITFQCAVTKPWLTPNDKEFKVGQRIFKPSVEKWTWKMIAAMSNLFPNLTFKMMYTSFSTLPFTEVRKRLDGNHAEDLRKMNNRQRSYSGFLIDLEQTQKDYSTELAAITAPTLIMHSQNDGSVPLSHPEYVKKLIPNAEMLLLDSWGHLIWIGKHASEYDEGLISFLSRHKY
jgi:Predicted hydrolases or acyltransferases (alpha/beta hydrolase superfamily)